MKFILRTQLPWRQRSLTVGSSAVAFPAEEKNWGSFFFGETTNFQSPNQMTGIEAETIRKYVENFNIQTKWTQPDGKGLRRYTKEYVDLLITTRDKVREDG